MKSTITSKGQITIPIRLRRKLNLKPGQVLEFDEKAGYLKATKVFDSQKMYGVIGCSKKANRRTAKQWLDETRGTADAPLGKDANGN
jgi:AbrB family looped-hinge helix DNA binding protein